MFHSSNTYMLILMCKFFINKKKSSYFEQINFFLTYTNYFKLDFITFDYIFQLFVFK